MSAPSTPADSVGLVVPRRVPITQPITLDCGRTLPHHELMVETYGALNAACSNAVLICHALSGDHHAAGYHDEQDRKPGWWDNCIGPGKPIDTVWHGFPGPNRSHGAVSSRCACAACGFTSEMLAAESNTIR